MFGRSDRCDFILEHPSASRYHAVLQYNDKGEAFVYDLGSTHGTFVNKRQVKPRVYTPVHVGAIFRFGLSIRLYVLQGPSELMPEERHSAGAAEAHMREMSLRRAKAEASALEGASWGMQEDAEAEEEEEDLDEVTWQTYKGSLTEKQQKTLEKVQKRHEKMGNLNKEIDAIRAKEGSQGGLTQGQQTQIARNEQRIEALMEELESLEETLNESIRESLGARSGKSLSKKKPHFEDEEDEDASDDEFYDRTNKRKQRSNKAETTQVVETAETLLEKRDVLAKEMDVVSAELEAEKAKSSTKEESNITSESIDPLDAFMSTVSTKIVKDKGDRLSKELSKLQAEADRVARLLKIADPSGDAAGKWDSKAQGSSQYQKVETIVENRLRLRASKEAARELASQAKELIEPAPEANNAPPTPDVSMGSIDNQPETKEMPVLAPTLLLGAPRPAPRPEAPQNEATKGSISTEENTETGNDFVGYKDRKRSAPKNEDVAKVEVVGDMLGSEYTDVASHAAMEAVALLMRHTSGFTTQEEVREQETQSSDSLQHVSATKTRGKKKRKLGPERPPALDNELDELEEAWVPPKGQTGDGRTALNAKFGY